MGEILFHILAAEIELIETSTTDQLEEGKLLTDIFNTLIPLEPVLIGDIDFGADLSGHPAGGNLGDKLVRDKADDNSNWERYGSEKERDTPLRTIQRSDLECSSSNENDHNLSPNHDNIDSDEEPIAGNTLKNVEFIVKTTVAIGGQRSSYRIRLNKHKETYLYWLKICIQTKVLKTRVFISAFP